MDIKELDAHIEEPFRVPDLAQLWMQILQCHKDLGFSIPLTNKERGGVLTDNEMIAEFQWIYSQYKKYIGTKKGPWLSMRDDLDRLIENVKDAILKDSETPEDRTKLVYQMMRNQWLNATLEQYVWLRIEMLKEEEEDDW